MAWVRSLAQEFYTPQSACPHKKKKKREREREKEKCLCSDWKVCILSKVRGTLLSGKDINFSAEWNTPQEEQQTGHWVACP